MTREEIDAYADANEVPIILFDGLDEAVIGISTDDRAVYSYERIIKVLSKDMSYEEAMEYADFNIVGFYVENGPIVIYEEVIWNM